jgi:hypothetical protein
VAFWGDAPEAWDTVIIEGLALPGTCDIRGEGFEQRVHRIKARGKHGSTHRYVGTANVDFEVIVKLWTAQHLRDFETLVDLITHAPPPKKRVTKQLVHSGGHTGPTGATQYTDVKEVTTVEWLESSGPRTVDIYHPALALFGIRTATVMRVSIPEPETRDVYRASLRCSQLHLGNRNAGTGTKQAGAAGATDATGSLLAAQPTSLLRGP